MGEVVELTDVELGDGGLDKESDSLTTQAPAPYLGQFVDADTEVELGTVSTTTSCGLRQDGSRRILSHTAWPR